MFRLAALSVAVLAMVFALSAAVPAIGGPHSHAVSSANPVALAKKALKKAKKADRTARQARKKANDALARLNRRGGFLVANVQTVTSARVSIAPGTVSSASVSCPSGTVVLSGGYSLVGPEANVYFDHRLGNGWSVGGDNTAAVAGNADLTAEAQCAPTGNAVVSSRSRRADLRRDRRLVERQTAAPRAP
jgi:hypothetical protein